MASRVFFDPVVALRALPLVSSTCTLLFGRDQSFFLGLLNRPETRNASKPMLRTYFSDFFQSGVKFVVAAIGVSFWSGVANIFVRRTVLESRGSFWWYAAGSTAALSHLLFVPLVARPIQDIVEDKEGVDPNERLGDWIGVNSLRTWTVDLLGWVSFAMAVGKTLE